jgi:hypothetical protein
MSNETENPLNRYAQHIADVGVFINENMNPRREGGIKLEIYGPFPAALMDEEVSVEQTDYSGEMEGKIVVCYVNGVRVSPALYRQCRKEARKEHLRGKVQVIHDTAPPREYVMKVSKATEVSYPGSKPAAKTSAKIAAVNKAASAVAVDDD